MTQHILIADDDASIAEMLSNALQQEGYETSKAVESLRFFDAVRAERPDLILLDLRMPYLTGEDELKLMKMDPTTADIPVIVVTADPDAPAQEVHYRSLGVREIVMKPFHMDNLLALIKDAIGEPRGGQP